MIVRCTALQISRIEKSASKYPALRVTVSTTQEDTFANAAHGNYPRVDFSENGRVPRTPPDFVYRCSIAEHEAPAMMAVIRVRSASADASSEVMPGVLAGIGIACGDPRQPFTRRMAGPKCPHPRRRVLLELGNRSRE
jgi:hypothetical protein